MKTTSSLLTMLKAASLAAALAVLPLPIAAAGDPPSTLLEKGIYTEETKGDLDSAIKIYQQLVSEVKDSQSLAAQAQFRIAQCYLKKKQSPEATAAFEKLIQDFPNEKDLVAKARTHLPPALTLQPVMWEDGERQTQILYLMGGMEIGVLQLRADLVDSGGRKIWRVGRRMSGGGECVSTVDVEPDSFNPLKCYWKHTLLGEITGVFKPDEVELTSPGKDEVTKIHPERPIYENEEGFHLIRRLPLKVGYKTTLPLLVALTNGTKMNIGLEVPKKEIIETPAGKFDCFKVQLNIAQTLWYADNARRDFVKFEGGGAIGLLASTVQHKAGEPVKFQDDELGISLTAPENWIFHRFKNPGKNKQVVIRAYDATADADDSGLRLFATDTLPEAQRKSSRVWAEAELADLKTALGGEVRPDSWKELSVSGRPAVSFIVDYKDAKPKVLYAVHSIGPKTSECFVIAGSPEKFDALKAALDGIIASYKTTK